MRRITRGLRRPIPTLNQKGLASLPIRRVVEGCGVGSLGELLLQGIDGAAFHDGLIPGVTDGLLPGLDGVADLLSRCLDVPSHRTEVPGEHICQNVPESYTDFPHAVENRDEHTREDRREVLGPVDRIGPPRSEKERSLRARLGIPRQLIEGVTDDGLTTLHQSVELIEHEVETRRDQERGGELQHRHHGLTDGRLEQAEHLEDLHQRANELDPCDDAEGDHPGLEDVRPLRKVDEAERLLLHPTEGSDDRRKDRLSDLGFDDSHRVTEAFARLSRLLGLGVVVIPESGGEDLGLFDLLLESFLVLGEDGEEILSLPSKELHRVGSPDLLVRQSREPLGDVPHDVEQVPRGAVGVLRVDAELLEGCCGLPALEACLAEVHGEEAEGMGRGVEVHSRLLGHLAELGQRGSTDVQAVGKVLDVGSTLDLLLEELLHEVDSERLRNDLAELLDAPDEPLDLLLAVLQLLGGHVDGEQSEQFPQRAPLGHQPTSFLVEVSRR